MPQYSQEGIAVAKEKCPTDPAFSDPKFLAGGGSTVPADQIPEGGLPTPVVYNPGNSGSTVGGGTTSSTVPVIGSVQSAQSVRMGAQSVSKTAAEFLTGQIPATIRECVERSKIATLARTDDLTGQVTSDDLIVAMKGMEPHMLLLNGAKTGDGPSALEVSMACLGAGIGKAVAATSGTNLPPILKQLAEHAVGQAMVNALHAMNATGSGAGLKTADEVGKLGIDLNGERKPAATTAAAKPVLNGTKA
jgi:hypothetical protein